jgi:hypothetical protein
MNIKHGYKTRDRTYPEYAVWSAMIQRCENSNHKSFHHYGGRGIVVCEDWRKNFVTFLLDMGNRPSSKHSIERKNNNEEYSKVNCVWALPEAQNTNKRNNIYVTHKGAKILLVEYARETGITYQAAHKRVQRARASGRDKLMDGTVVRREP